jgi:hypothetical protein
MRTLGEVADALAERLVSIFLADDAAGGRRPVFGDQARFQQDSAWHDTLLFHEYFHGDTGAGLGASHQTGWTGLVAGMIVRHARARETKEQA